MKAYKKPHHRIRASISAEILCLILFSILCPNIGQSQTSTAPEETDTPDQRVKNVLDDHLIPSARGAALSGALVTSADDLDAAVYNPAGIGGLNWGKQKTPWIRKLYFPWIGGSANQNSTTLSKEFSSAGGDGDRAVGKSVLAAHAGKRQYARANALFGLVFGRTLLIPINDTQVAATSQTQEGLIDGHYRGMTGFAGGFSAQTTDGSLSVGYLGYSVNRTDVEGTFNYDDMLDSSARSQALSAARVKSQGSGHHGGMIWKLGKTWSPTLGIALRDIGGTTFASKTEGAPNQKLPQDASLGISFGPSFKSSGGVMLTLQGDRLFDPEVSLSKKYRVGLELSLGGAGSYSTFALRAGATQAGPSGGLALNLGLIGFNVGAHSVDIGAVNQRVIETRAVADVYVNVAEF